MFESDVRHDSFRLNQASINSTVRCVNRSLKLLPPQFTGNSIFFAIWRQIWISIVILIRQNRSAATLAWRPQSLATEIAIVEFSTVLAKFLLWRIVNSQVSNWLFIRFEEVAAMAEFASNGWRRWGWIQQVRNLTALDVAITWKSITASNYFPGFEVDQLSAGYETGRKPIFLNEPVLS